MELSTRELASVILVAVFVGVLLTVPKHRRSLLPSTRAVVRAFLVPKLLVIVAVYFAYVATLIFAASQLRIWDFDLLKDTVIITLFVGFPILMDAHRIRTGKSLLKKVIRETIGVSVLVAFYLNLEPLPLWGELILQPLITFFSLMVVVGRREQKTRAVARFFEVLVAVVGFGLLIFTTLQIFRNWRTYDLAELASLLALSIWLPALLLPLIYVFAVVMHTEIILTRLQFFNDRKKVKLRVRLALLVGLRFSAHLASSFRGSWLQQIAQATKFREGLRVMNNYRQFLKDQAEAERQRLARLREFSGVDGVGDDGLVLDRREFAETKSILTDLFYMQMGWHRNRLHHFKDDMLSVLGDVTKKGLPADHGIALQVRNDKQAWMAWRRTPSGYYFAVGGTGSIEDHWQYDGRIKPPRFPASAAGWINATKSASSAEWAASDKSTNLTTA